MFLDLATLAMVALACASVSMTVARSRLFARPRQWLTDRSAWLGKLVTCPYCFSHWVALAMVLALDWLGWRALVIDTFAVVTLAAPLQWLIYQAISAITETE